jgi:hypothetical protein
MGLSRIAQLAHSGWHDHVLMFNGNKMPVWMVGTMPVQLSPTNFKTFMAIGDPAKRQTFGTIYFPVCRTRQVLASVFVSSP